MNMQKFITGMAAETFIETDFRLYRKKRTHYTEIANIYYRARTGEQLCFI